jgi:hypothetical protein
MIEMRTQQILKDMDRASQEGHRETQRMIDEGRKETNSRLGCLSALTADVAERA